MTEQLSAGLELEHLEALLDSIRDATRARLSSESSIRGLAPAALVVGAGAGDVTYGIDLESEEVVTSWFEERARRRTLPLH